MPDAHAGEARKLDRLVFGATSAAPVTAMTADPLSLHGCGGSQCRMLHGFGDVLYRAPLTESAPSAAAQGVTPAAFDARGFGVADKSDVAQGVPANRRGEYAGRSYPKAVR